MEIIAGAAKVKTVVAKVRLAGDEIIIAVGAEVVVDVVKAELRAAADKSSAAETIRVAGATTIRTVDLVHSIRVGQAKGVRDLNPEIPFKMRALGVRHQPSLKDVVMTVGIKTVAAAITLSHQRD